MALDARIAVFERIGLLWKPSLRTPERVDRSTNSIGWHCYELEASFACDYGQLVYLAEHVGQNFVGTILIPEKIVFHRGRGYRCIYGNVVGFDLYYTIERFCEKVKFPAPVFP